MDHLVQMLEGPCQGLPGCYQLNYAFIDGAKYIISITNLYTISFDTLGQSNPELTNTSNTLNHTYLFYNKMYQPDNVAALSLSCQM